MFIVTKLDQWKINKNYETITLQVGSNSYAKSGSPGHNTILGPRPTF